MVVYFCVLYCLWLPASRCLGRLLISNRSKFNTSWWNPSSLAALNALKLVIIFKGPVVKVGLLLDGVSHHVLVSRGLFRAFVGEHFVDVSAISRRRDEGNDVRFNFLGIKLLPVYLLKESMASHVVGAFGSSAESFRRMAL